MADGKREFLKKLCLILKKGMFYILLVVYPELFLWDQFENIQGKFIFLEFL